MTADRVLALQLRAVERPRLVRKVLYRVLHTLSGTRSRAFSYKKSAKKAVA